jgi:hypothetical protein
MRRSKHMPQTASITAPDDLHYGDSFTPAFDPGNWTQRKNEYLYADLYVFQKSVVYNGLFYETLLVMTDRINLDGGVPLQFRPFLLSGGYWEGGAATASVKMYTFDFQNARTRDLAWDQFEIAA